MLLRVTRRLGECDRGGVRMFAPLAPREPGRKGGAVRRLPAPSAPGPASPSFPPRVDTPAALAVGRYDDPLEHDADRIAAQALDESRPSVARPTRLDSARHEPAIEAPSAVHAALRAHGQPPDPAARAPFDHPFRPP